MECPVCGQINSDNASTCLSCGRSLPPYMGGASIDTTRTEDKNHMVVAGNIEFPLPPSNKPASSPPLSSQLPKPSLPRVETVTSPEEKGPSAAVTDDDPTTILQPPLSPPLDIPLQVTAMGRPANMIYAGFWYRFLAWLIDIIVIGAVQGVFWLIFVMISAAFVLQSGKPSPESSMLLLLGIQGVMYLFILVSTLLYFTWCESSRWQATLGKLAIGLKVTDIDGQRLSFLRALARYIAHIISNLTFGIGYLMNVFTARQQTLHDMLAGTLVVYKEVAPHDLELNPSVLVPSAQKVSAVLAWVACSLLFVSFVVAMGALLMTSLPGHQASGIPARMHEAEMLGAQATAAVSDYQESYGQFPPSLEAADFHQTSPQVRRLWIDAESGVIHVELAFVPLRKKTLDFVPEFDENNDLIWRCRSGDIAPQYLPEHCR